MPNKIKKILFLEQYAKLSGGQRVLLSLIKGLKDCYHLCVVVPGRGDLTAELERLNIEYTIFPMGYYALGKKTLFDMLTYTMRIPYLTHKLKSLIKAKNIDLVYANGARSFVWGTIACHLTKTAMIWHLHSIFAKGLIRRLCIFFGKARIVKKIIAVSGAVKSPLPGLSEKTEIIYNAVDTGAYFPKDEKSGLLRKQLKIGDNPLIAMVGFLMPWKGIGDLIRAAKIVNSRYPQAKFAIVGDVLYDKTGQRYKQHLTRLVNELDLNSNVLFSGFRDDVPEIMRQLDIFVLASKKPDPCPTSLIQAMASGAAAIATAFGGPAEIISDSEDGLLYAPGDYQALAEKILFLLDNPQARKNISDNAAQKIKQNFNQSDYLTKVKEIIEASL